MKLAKRQARRLARKKNADVTTERAAGKAPMVVAKNRSIKERAQRVFPRTKATVKWLSIIVLFATTVLVPIGLALGLALSQAAFVTAIVISMFAIPIGGLMLLAGASSDAVDEGKKHFAQQRVIKAREKHPVAGAISIAVDGGDLSEVDEDQSGAVAELDDK